LPEFRRKANAGHRFLAPRRGERSYGAAARVVAPSLLQTRMECPMQQNDLSKSLVAAP
jgi:hypothetical protein